MKTLILIDLSGLFWAHWHATEHQPVGEAYQRTVDQVRAASDGFDFVAVCCDHPPYKRREIFPEYKAQREKHPPQALQQLDDVKARCADDGLLVWSVPGFEADDVIATATRLALAEETPLVVTVLSGDKDMLQLVTDGVTVLSPRSGSYDATAVQAKFGVPPRLIGDLLALMGDASDNLPGVPGVGPVKGAQLLLEFGSLAGVIGGALAIKAPKLRESVIASRETVLMSRRCIELASDAPLDWDALFAKRTPKPEPKREDFSTMDQDEIGEHDAVWEPVKDDADTEPPSAPGAREGAEFGARLKGEPTPPTKALARIVQPSAPIVRLPFEQGLEPQSTGGAYKLAVGMFESGLYTKFKKPEAIWAIMIRGREMGIGALTALDCFHVVEGKPTLHAYLIIARAKAHPDCDYFQLIDQGEDWAVWESKGKRNPKAVVRRYSVADAQRAGVAPQRLRAEPVMQQDKWGKMKDVRGNWEKRPLEMVIKTGGVQLARVEFPSAALGLYATEELTDADDD